MSFSFPITSFEVVHFKKWTSLLFLVFFLIKLSLSHDPGERFILVTHIFLEVIFFIFFILSFKIQVFLKLNFFFLCFFFYWINLFAWYYLRLLTTSLRFADALFFNTLFYWFFPRFYSSTVWFLGFDNFF